MVVNLERVKEVVCDRRYHHYPEPPYLDLKISFRDEDENDDDIYPHELFGARFDEAREADYIALCNRHRLRKDGDW